MSNPIDGKTVCITGTFTIGDRRHIERRIIALGGTPVKTVTRNTDVLLCGAKPGAKLTDAKNRGIPVIYETEFSKIVRKEGGDAEVMSRTPEVAKTRTVAEMPENYGAF